MCENEIEVKVKDLLENEFKEKGIVVFDLHNEDDLQNTISHVQSHFAMKKLCQSEIVSKKFNDRHKKAQDKWFLKRLGR